MTLITTSKGPAPIIELPSTPALTALMKDLCAPSATPKSMQDTVHALTHQILTAAHTHDPTLAHTPTTLIPILRGALPMLTEGTADVAVEWLGRRPFPAAQDDGRLVVLDTVVATGDTIVQLCAELWALSGGTASIVVFCCYAAPAALERVAACPGVEYVVVGRRAERCDERGYLVPYTHGDIGDKIYGEKLTVERPVVAAGEDVSRVMEGIADLLAENGGAWRLDSEGSAIQRDFHFTGFNQAWAFMNKVAQAAKEHRHHPEWTNIYNNVSVRWTTHDPKGLTNLDVDMARLCDSYV
ncbi:Transcriptional coactivator/pterin dehydratase [Penicillium hetheringtonii]|uniref:4a-hydroxytetrahydrobiopterin dehydratase n=1 Tax=Penicillium hetheringtonii TaxID=911720 RepID=A0AAD6DH54_9EURO|nr:Transcriptional coactivator/pterin dehydratase [Penicillium hetheringtonii]